MPYQIDTEKFRQEMTPTGLDRAIGTVFPSWGARRVTARRSLAIEGVRREFAYQAAQTTRLRSTAKRLQGPEDYTAFPDRLQLIRNMRDMEQNFGLFQSIIDKLAIYAFGRLKFQPKTGDPTIDQMYAEYLADRFKNLDLSGRHNLRFLACLLFKSMLRDGDILAQWKKTPLGLRQTLIEGDRLGGIYMTSAQEDYFQGITIDVETGQPITYKIYVRTKANAFVTPYDAPAVDVLHVYDPRRYDQYRGVTPFAPILDEGRDLKEVLEACLIGTKFENYHSAFYFTDNGLLPEDPANYVTGADSELTPSGQPLSQQTITFGKVQAMPREGRVEWMKSERPSGTFQAYADMLIRLIGTALNLSHGFLYSLSGLAGPGARMDCQQSMRTVQWHQQNLTERYLDRTKDILLVEGIGDGSIPFRPGWRKGKWHFPPAVTIDVGRESIAGIKEWQAGLLSKEDWFGETGQDALAEEQVIYAEAERTIVSAQQLATKYSIPFEVALNLLEVKTPNGAQKGGGGGGGGGGDGGDPDGGGSDASTV